jgi:hypothetical protein
MGTFLTTILMDETGSVIRIMLAKEVNTKTHAPQILEQTSSNSVNTFNLSNIAPDVLHFEELLNKKLIFPYCSTIID